MDWTLTVVLILTFFFAEGQAKKKETKNVYRYFYVKGGLDHFYTTNWGEIGFLKVGEVGNYGYMYEGVGFKVLKKRKGSSTALYRYWNGKVTDHFYTTNKAEIGVNNVGEVGNHGYKLEGTLGFCFPSPESGTVPLFRYNHGGVHDHFYTTNWEELKAGAAGWNFEGIQCYVYPA